MRRKLNYMFSVVLSFCIQNRIYLPLVLLMLMNIKEKKANGMDRRVFSRPSNRITILALDSNRYRGDLEALATNKRFRILHMTQNAPGWLLKPFYKELNIARYIKAKKNSPDAIDHKNAFEFMQKFLNIFYKYVSVDCVTTVNFRYAEDHNWSKASDKIGVPFIMLYRECLFATESIYNGVYNRIKGQYGRFHGSHIIVHNDVTKELFIKSGYCKKENISVCGALRMDFFMKSIQSNINLNRNIKFKKRFILFYFRNSMGMYKSKASNIPNAKYKDQDSQSIWEHKNQLFTDLHEAIIELAEENRDIQFIIKPKDIMMQHRTWEKYKEVVSSSKINVHNLKNYSVEPEANVHEMILDSDIICGLQSSTILESAIADKRVILPLFYNFLKTDYVNNLFWKNDLDLFDVATSKEYFKQIFYKCLDEPNVSEEIMNKRKDLFELNFDSTQGNSLERYSSAIEKVINNC